MIGWVFLTIFIALAVVSAISHMIKTQKEEIPPPRRRVRRDEDEQVVQRATPAEQDRFKAEIERLRRRPAGPPVAKAVPVVKAKRQPMRVEELPPAEVKS